MDGDALVVARSARRGLCGASGVKGRTQLTEIAISGEAAAAQRLGSVIVAEVPVAHGRLRAMDAGTASSHRPRHGEEDYDSGGPRTQDLTTP